MVFIVTYGYHSILQFGRGSITLTGVLKCKKMLSAGTITEYSPPTFRLHSVPLTVPEVGGDALSHFMYAAGTASPCVPSAL